MDCHLMLTELPGMFVDAIREALRARGVGEEALKRGKIVLRDDLKVLLQKEVVQKDVETNPPQAAVVSESMGPSHGGASRALRQQIF